MKVLSMVFVMLMIVALATVAMGASQSFSIPITTGNWYLFAVPGIPQNPAPTAIFGTDANLKQNGLTGYNNALLNGTAYGDSTNPVGNILVGDGYWLTAKVTGTVGFTGYNDLDTNLNGTDPVSGKNWSNGMDTWISLPGGSATGDPAFVGMWQLVGNPYNSNFLFANVMVTDGNVSKTITEAESAGWMQDQAFVWSNDDLQSGDLISIKKAGQLLKPWQAVWLQCNVNNLALIYTKVVLVP